MSETNNLHEVNDGEPIGDVWLRVGDHEVEPLGVLLSVQVCPQPQFILVLATVITKHHQQSISIGH